MFYLEQILQEKLYIFGTK